MKKRRLIRYVHIYHDVRILDESDEDRKKSYIGLIDMVKGILETSIDLLGFSAPDRM